MSIIVFEPEERADKAVAYPPPPLPGVTQLKAGIREECVSGWADVA